MDRLDIRELLEWAKAKFRPRTAAVWREGRHLGDDVVLEDDALFPELKNHAMAVHTASAALLVSGKRI